MGTTLYLHDLSCVPKLQQRYDWRSASWLQGFQLSKSVSPSRKTVRARHCHHTRNHHSYTRHTPLITQVYGRGLGS